MMKFFMAHVEPMTTDGCFMYTCLILCVLTVTCAGQVVMDSSNST